MNFQLETVQTNIFGVVMVCGLGTLDILKEMMKKKPYSALNKGVRSKEGKKIRDEIPFIFSTVQTSLFSIAFVCSNDVG